MKGGHEGGCYGSTEFASVAPRASWCKIFMEKASTAQEPAMAMAAGTGG